MVSLPELARQGWLIMQSYREHEGLLVDGHNFGPVENAQSFRDADKGLCFHRF